MVVMHEIFNKAREIEQSGNGLYGKDFLLTWEKELNDLRLVLSVADILMQMRSKGLSPRVFDSGLAVSNFRDKSTRTRFSFASACNLLGLAVQDLDEEKSQLSHGETSRETAVMVSFLTDFIGIRDDIFLGEGNRYMREVASALDESFSAGILPLRPGIVNLQCDMDHPTQSLADLMHLEKEFGSLEALRGKKIVMSWAYSPSYGKPLSVPQGVTSIMTRLGMNVVLAHPEGYGLIPEIVKMASENARDSGGTFSISNSMEDAVRDADIVYPKSWAPYQIMERRTAMLKAGDSKALEDLEKECLNENSRHVDWEYGLRTKSLTAGRNALYMHCLPADISGVSCSRGEVSGEVFEYSRLDTYRQAGYKPYIIAAMMLCNRFASPSEMLSNILEKDKSRISQL